MRVVRTSHLVFSFIVAGLSTFSFGQDLEPPTPVADYGTSFNLTDESTEPTVRRVSSAIDRVDLTGLETTSDLTKCDSPTCDSKKKPCGCPKCDKKKMKELKGKIAGSHKGLFYNNDFSYINDPCYCDWWPGDLLKQLKPTCCSTLDIGGQYRMRLHNERHHRGLGISGNNDDFLLHRTRIFMNLKVGDSFRAYAEYIDAESNYENFGPRPIEVNRSDVQNLFVDAKLLDNDLTGALWARVGRQELLYGAQRTISPLDWANTRRTFEGYKFFSKGKDWDIDAFYVNPIQTDPRNFDNHNDPVEFMGIYSTYKGMEKETLDLYYLKLNNRGTLLSFDTMGLRYAGSRDSWLWEFEGAYQWGHLGANNHDAGAWTCGFGRKFECLPWKPTVWAWYDWASGSITPGNGYHHLFPLAHKYLGFMDLFGRRNIQTPNIQAIFTPHEKLKFLMWFYVFRLETIFDTPYNVNMTAYNPPGAAPLGASGSRHLGEELDCVVTYSINPRMNILFGYSHFWAGQYYATTANAVNSDADFYYTQFQVNF